MAAAAAAGQRSPLARRRRRRRRPVERERRPAARPRRHVGDRGRADRCRVVRHRGRPEDARRRRATSCARPGADRYAVAAGSTRWPGRRWRPGSGLPGRRQGPTNAFAGALLAGLHAAPAATTRSPTACRPTVRARAGRPRRVTGWPCSAARRSVRRARRAARAVPQHRRDPSSVGAGQQAQRDLPQELRALTTSSCRRCRTPTGQRLRCGRGRGPRQDGVGSYAAGAGRVGIDTALPLLRHPEGALRQVPRPAGPHLDRHLVRCGAGYSEHQTGLTVDLLPIGRSNCRINDCIDETPQGRVARAGTSWRYGFVLRYEKGHTLDDRASASSRGTSATSGATLARAYHDGGWHTYEQFLGEPAAPSY